MSFNSFALFFLIRIFATMKHIEVVAAIIRKEEKIFATQRGYGEWKVASKREQSDACIISVEREQARLEGKAGQREVVAGGRRGGGESEKANIR